MTRRSLAAALRARRHSLRIGRATKLNSFVWETQMGLAQMGLADYSPEGSKKNQKQIRELTDAGDKQTTLREAEIRQTGGAALVFVLVMRAPLGNVMICCVFSPRRVWGKSATNHHIP